MESFTHTKILVREVMNSPVIYAFTDETVLDVAFKMLTHKIGSLVIVKNDESRCVVGIVTLEDVVKRAVVKDVKPSSLKASDVMSQPLYTVEADTDITEAARVMRKVGHKRLGVTYKGKLVGMVTMSDILSVTPELIDIALEKARIMTGESGRRLRYVEGFCDMCRQWSEHLLETEGKFLCEECRLETIEEQ